MRILSVVLCLVLASLFVPKKVRAETWVVSAETNFSPYNFFDDSGVFTGIDVEIMKAAAARIGVSLDFQPAPWARVMVLLEQNEIDFAFQLKPTSERFEAFHMIGPFRYGNTALATLKSSTIEYRTLEDLKSYVIGTVRGYVYPGQFGEADFLTKDETEGAGRNLLKLLNTRVDLIAGDRNSIAFEANRLGRLDEIRFLDPPLSELPRYAAFPKARTDKAERFRQAIEDIIQDGTVAAILSDYSGS